MRCIPSISRVIPGRSRSVFLASDELLTSVAGCFLKERFPPLTVRVLTFMVALWLPPDGVTRVIRVTRYDPLWPSALARVVRYSESWAT